MFATSITELKSSVPVCSLSYEQAELVGPFWFRVSRDTEIGGVRLAVGDTCRLLYPRREERHGYQPAVRIEILTAATPAEVSSRVQFM